jgi:homoaconitase/3-isopropylmalate dehydratase large subunit
MEYAGEAIEELSVDERATMTNMAAEIGGFTGIVAPDRKAVDFLVERRGMDRKKAEAHDRGPVQRSDAQYAHVIELDAAEITPMVATPGDPGNGKYSRPEHAGPGRDRLRRHLHSRKERRHGYVRRRAGRRLEARQARGRLR